MSSHKDDDENSVTQEVHVHVQEVSSSVTTSSNSIMEEENKMLSVTTSSDQTGYFCKAPYSFSLSDLPACSRSISCHFIILICCDVEKHLY